MSKSRVEAFTDAVIAIVMTLLVLEMPQPDGVSFSALLQISHKFIIYVVSFATLAIYWNNHHHLFQAAKKVNGRVLWANNFLIFAMTMFPFATAWVGDHVFSLVPQLTFGVVLLFADVSYYVLYRTLFSPANLIKGGHRLYTEEKKMYITMAGNILALMLGVFIHPLLVIITNAVTYSLWLIPSKKIESHYQNEE